MLKKHYLLKNVSPALRSGLIVAAVALLPLTEAVGGGTTTTTSTSLLPYVAAPAPVPRFCDATGIGGSSDDDRYAPAVNVHIVAGPLLGSSPDLTRLFPQPAVSPECPGGMAACLRWDYTWIYSVAIPPTPTYAVVAFDSDINVTGANPSTATSPAVITSVKGDPVSGYGVNKASEIGLRFPSSGQTFAASFYTGVNVGVGTMTAGFSAGKRKGYCAIAGADNPPTSGNANLSQSHTERVTVLGGKCTYDLEKSPDGCLLSAALVGSPVSDLTCNAPTFKALGTPDGTVLGATCGSEVTGSLGSTDTCRWSSFLRTFICMSTSP